MKLHYAIAFGLIFLAACDANAPVRVNQRCVEVNLTSIERLAAEVERGARVEFEPSHLLQLGPPELRSEIERLCDCWQRVLTAKDYQFLIGAIELRESLLAEELPSDVIIYRIEQYAAEHTGGDGDAGEAHIDRLVELGVQSCPTSTQP